MGKRQAPNAGVISVLLYNFVLNLSKIQNFGMQCKAHGAQHLKKYNPYGEGASTVQRRNAPER